MVMESLKTAGVPEALGDHAECHVERKISAGHVRGDGWRRFDVMNGDVPGVSPTPMVKPAAVYLGWCR